MWEQNRRQEEALTVGEDWLRSEDEAEGGRGTANGSLLLVGWGVPIQGWMGADPGVRSEEVGRARRQPGRAATGRCLSRQAMRAGVLKLH